MFGRFSEPGRLRSHLFSLLVWYRLGHRSGLRHFRPRDCLAGANCGVVRNSRNLPREERRLASSADSVCGGLRRSQNGVDTLIRPRHSWTRLNPGREDETEHHEDSGGGDDQKPKVNAGAGECRRICRVRNCEFIGDFLLLIFSLFGTLFFFRDSATKRTLPWGRNSGKGSRRCRRIGLDSATTAVRIVSAKRCRTALSFSPKARAFSEKTSSRPIDLSPETIGAARMERMPKARHVSGSTRSSESASSQRNVFLLRTHSPEKPEPTCKTAPSGGALWPALARQIMVSTSLPTIAMAAPEARSRDCERAAIKARTAARLAPKDSASAARRRRLSAVGVVRNELDLLQCGINGGAGTAPKAAALAAAAMALRNNHSRKTVQENWSEQEAEADTSGPHLTKPHGP